MGIVYGSFRKEALSAMKGKGSFQNGQPIHVSTAEKLSGTMIDKACAREIVNAEIIYI